LILSFAQIVDLVLQYALPRQLYLGKNTGENKKTSLLLQCTRLFSFVKNLFDSANNGQFQAASILYLQK
jgi:hypothetical protein